MNIFPTRSVKPLNSIRGVYLGDDVYQCTECNFSIETAQKCPECFEGCPLCGAEMEEW